MFTRSLWNTLLAKKDGPNVDAEIRAEASQVYVSGDADGIQFGEDGKVEINSQVMLRLRAMRLSHKRAKSAMHQAAGDMQRLHASINEAIGCVEERDGYCAACIVLDADSLTVGLKRVGVFVNARKVKDENGKPKYVNNEGDRITY